MSSAVSSSGTLLKIGDGGSPESFTTIAEVKDIDGPAFALSTEEVTSHDSTGHYREYIPTLKESGEVSFSLNFFAGATQGFASGLFNDYDNRTLRNFQLVLTTSGNDTGSFAAYVTAFQLHAPVEGVLSADCTLMVVGGVTWA